MKIPTRRYPYQPSDLNQLPTSPHPMICITSLSSTSQIKRINHRKYGFRQPLPLDELNSLLAHPRVHDACKARLVIFKPYNSISYPPRSETLNNCEVP